jgi:hypothetical protein
MDKIKARDPDMYVDVSVKTLALAVLFDMLVLSFPLTPGFIEWVWDHQKKTTSPAVHH